MAPVNYSSSAALGENPADTWAQMIQQAQGLNPVDTDLGDLGALASMTPDPATAQPPGPQMQSPPWATKITKTVRVPSQGGNMSAANADMLELVKQYNQKQQEALAAQSSGVDDLAARVKQIQGMPSNPVGAFRPLAQFYGMNPAALPEYESPEQKAQRLLGLQNELQKARQGLSKEQADTLKDQIAALKATKDNSLQDQLTIAKTNAFNNVAGRQQNRLDTMSYNQLLQDVKKDPNLNKNMTYYANLSNSLDNVIQPDKTPVQQLNELQQTIRGSTGLKGQSGIAERSDDYIKFFGSDGTKIAQYMSGKIQNVPDGIKQQMVDHLGQIVEIEKRNIARQQAARFDQLAGGQYSLLRRNPQYKADLDQFKTDYLGALNSMSSAPQGGGSNYKEGDTVDYGGKKYRLSNGTWAEVK